MFGSVNRPSGSYGAVCGHQVARPQLGARTESGSGRPSLEASRVTMLRSRRGCPRPSARDGSGRLAGCHRFRWPRYRSAICHLLQREEIAILRAQDVGVREIARRLGPDPSTISRELRRNASTRTYRLEYRATSAQWHAKRRASRPKLSKLAANDALREYVKDRLLGTITRPDGERVPGPEVRWTRRRHGRRQDRRWATAWSPEQIANRLRVDFPDDASMRISHEAIYQALYVQGRGALKRELVACLRTGRALRVPRARAQGRGKTFVTGEIMISERPAEIADRAVPGHWEGDLILGLGSSAIGTLVERTTRFTMLLHLPRMDGHGDGPSVKNGPPLAGHGAEAVRDAIASCIMGLPAQLRITTGLEVYLCDPHSPWQRGTNENTNGLLRQYFPKGTDLARHSTDDLTAVAATLNGRPPQDTRMEDPSRSSGRVPMLISTRRCCDDRSNPPTSIPLLARTMTAYADTVRRLKRGPFTRLTKYY